MTTPLTADTILYTADTTSLTADQTQTGAVVGVPLTADTTFYTADTTGLTADQTYIVSVGISAAVNESVGGVPLSADTTLYTADTIDLTADQTRTVAGALDVLDGDVVSGVVGIAADLLEAAAAQDDLDAAIIPGVVAIIGGGAARIEPRRVPVEGYGYGILPELEGEAYGVVGAVGATAAQIAVRANALGDHGSAGGATAILKGFDVAGVGAIGARGNAAGTLDLDLNATLIGQYDDDEAAVIAFLLAA